MTTRLTRDERKQRTRTELIQTARRVFLDRGYHAASLDEIAEEAGYTKGAIYSNFAGKDALFLEILDARMDARLRADVDAALGAGSFEDSLRAVARNITQASQQDLQWTPLLVEFWTHAARNRDVFILVSERHERGLDAIAALLTEVADRHGIRYRVPVREAARGAAALGRGMSLEWLLDAQTPPPGVFEEMFVAYFVGLTRPGDDSGRRRGS